MSLEIKDHKGNTYESFDKLVISTIDRLLNKIYERYGRYSKYTITLYTEGLIACIENKILSRSTLLSNEILNPELYYIGYLPYYVSLEDLIEHFDFYEHKVSLESKSPINDGVIRLGIIKNENGADIGRINVAPEEFEEIFQVLIFN